MKQFFEKCSEFRTENNRRTVFIMLKRIFDIAMEDGLITLNPCNGIKIKIQEKEQKVLTNSEVEIFLSEAKALNHQFYPIWVTALLTGMRSGELFALRWTDIDLEGRIISVSKQWTSKNGFGPTKTKRSRVVPISDELLSFLKELKILRRNEEFVLPHLHYWKKGEQARVTRYFCKGVGITQVKFHDLRATFITNLLARGESLARVMAVVGHTELKTTNGYLRKAGVEVQGATEKLGYKLPQSVPGIVLNFKKNV